jgi:hypothetical protein
MSDLIFMICALAGIRIPMFVKIRLLNTVDETIELVSTPFHHLATAAMTQGLIFMSHASFAIAICCCRCGSCTMRARRWWPSTGGTASTW